MSRPWSRTSAALRFAASALTLLLALAPGARAQDCSWNVDLPGAAHRWLTLASDGAHGVLAVSYPEQWVDHATMAGTLRLHHVLEHGALDPAFPASGVTFFAPPAGETHRGVLVLSALPDDAGGAWVLGMHNDPYAPKLRAYETATFRLHHVSASGAVAPGWIAGGLLLPSTYGSPVYADHAGIVPDGAGGVIVVWTAPATMPRSYVRAQRFAQDGTPLWPGGNDGIMVSDSLRVRTRLRIAGDGAGGFGAAVATQLTQTSERDARAFRVLANGSRAWAFAGELVHTPVGEHESPDCLAFDGGGNLFVMFRSEPVVPGPSRTMAQLLGPDAGKLFDGVLGLELGPVTSGGAMVLSVPAGFFTVQASTTSGTSMQLLDASGAAYWGEDVNGVPSPPYALPPIRLSGGDPTFVWADPASLYSGPPTVIHALEIDANGVPAAGWPADGVVVCGALYGHIMTDAVTPDGESLVVGLGTDYYSTIPPRITRLSRSALGVPGGPPVTVLELLPPSPNPAHDAWAVRFTLAAPSEASLELFDLAGRRVAREQLGSLEAGPHAVRFAPRATLPPGAYRLRLQSAGGSAQRLVVRVR